MPELVMLGIVLLLAAVVILRVGDAVRMKVCPHCRERVDRRATRCSHCQGDLSVS